MAALANGSPKYSNSLICCSPRNDDEHSKSPSSSTSGCVSADDSYDSNCIPKSIGNKKLKIHSSATKEDIEKAITQSKELILSSAQCSDERKWLVRYLIELRLRLEDLKDNDGQPRLGVSIKGHHFKQQVNVSNRKQHCDHCSGVIWNIVQGSYICNDCGYLCHYKCVDHICRVCAHVVMTEKGEFEMSICPEKGLAAQDYKCAECHAALTFGVSWNEPRLCDYTGLYFCTTCHWNDMSAIPARVVHNWDWDKRYVSRLAYQMLTISWDRPYIDIEAINPKLFGFSPDMDWVHIMRKNLEWMRRYLCACSEGSSLITPLFMQLGDVNKKYSMSHLQDVYETTDSQLAKLIEVCRIHITNCPLCSGKGYLCEICGNNEVLFPFDMGAILCEKCNTMSHRNCFRLKGDFCRKCQRIESKKSQKETPSDEQTDGATEFDIDRFVE